MDTYKVKSSIVVKVEADNEAQARTYAWDELTENFSSYPIEDKLNSIITSWTKVEKIEE